jgi:hypothetical protein
MQDDGRVQLMDFKDTTMQSQDQDTDPISRIFNGRQLEQAPWLNRVSSSPGRGLAPRVDMDGLLNFRAAPLAPETKPLPAICYLPSDATMKGR